MGRTYQTSDFRNGLKVEVDGAPYEMVYFQFVKPGKGTAFTRTKLKSLLSGNTIERTFRTGEKLQPADVSDADMQYLYGDGEFRCFLTCNFPKDTGVSSVIAMTSGLIAGLTNGEFYLLQRDPSIPEGRTGMFQVGS